MESSLFQYLVAEVFDAQTQSGNPQFANRLDLGFREGARFAFERDFLGLVPVDAGAEAVDQRRQLFRAQEGRRAATEIDEPKRALAHHR